MLACLLSLLLFVNAVSIPEQDIVYRINTANVGWRARPTSLAHVDPKSLMNYVASSEETKIAPYQVQGKTLPSAFDSRVEWPNCTAMFKPLNQGTCGSCWAFGCVKSLSQRFCVATKGAFNDELSEQQMVSCNLDGIEGCSGGDPVTAFRYAGQYGIPLSTCVPYVSGQNGTVPACSGSSCVAQGQKWEAFYADLLSIRWHLTLNGIQEAIMTNGPVEACFDVYQDFLYYQSGVYKHTTGDFLGGHCIVLVGWGVTPDGTQYWIAQNSWGASWGMSGFFWIARGVDECGIEWKVFSALPKTN